MTKVVLNRELLVRAAAAVLEGVGVGPLGAGVVAGALVDGDARGIPSHGLMLLPMYVDRLLAGSVSTIERADVVTDAGAIAILDGGHALGQLTGDQAMGLAVDKAGKFGIGVVTVRHAFHFGGAYRYVEQAAAAGCLGIAAANTRPLMPAPGGASRVVGNNPLAIGVPRRGDAPIILDMALSEAALGKIRLAQAEGRTIPPTWASGPDGVPTTDPAAALAGMLLPMAGPKGYGLAFMVDVLTGVLSGGAFGDRVQGLYSDVGTPNDCAHFFLALDIASFGDLTDFQARLGELAQQVTQGPRAPGVARLYLPGQRESESMAAARGQGVGVDESVLSGLRTTAASLGVPLPEELW